MGVIFERDSFKLFLNLFYVKILKLALPHYTKPSDINSVLPVCTLLQQRKILEITCMSFINHHV